MRSSGSATQAGRPCPDRRDRLSASAGQGVHLDWRKRCADEKTV